MKKHVWAIVLAMLLVIGLMPAAMAEDSEQTGLMFREMYWDENDEPALADELRSEWETTPGSENVVKFFYVTDENPDGVEVPLEDLTFSGISAEYFRDTDFIYLLVEEFGECTVSYEADGETHTLVINSVLPSFGFYSEPEISEENYLSVFTLTEVGQSIYFIAGEGATVSTIEGGGFAAYTEMTQISDTCWQITFTGRPWFQNGFYGLPITGTDNGEYVEGGAMLHIIDKMPGLVFRYSFHDGENFVEDEYDYFHGIMEEAVIYEPVVRFYFYDGEENYEPVPVEDLLSTGDIWLSAENEDLVRLSFTAVGTGCVIYERDGETYYSTIITVLPEFGFYTEPYVSEDTVIIRNFEVTAENNTIYLIVNNDPNNEYSNLGQIFDLELMGHFGEIATARPYTDDLSCWEITINGRARSGEWYDVRFSGTNRWGDPFEEYWEGLHLFDNSPALVVRYADHDGENFFENEEYSFDYEMYLTPNHRPVVKFYFFDGENYHGVDPDALFSQNDITINRIEGTDFVEIVVNAWGNLSITCNFEGNYYSLPVYVHLPEVGFYYEPYASEETYINEFVVSSEGAVCYVVSTYDATLTNVYLADEFNDVATIEQLDDTCWKITFTGEPWDDHWYRICCDGVRGDGSEFYGMEESILVRNAMPHLVYRDLYWIDDGVWGEDENWSLIHDWYGPINRSTFARIYFFDGENYYGVDPDALTCSEGITINRIEGTDYIEFITNAWGNHSIDYEVDGVVYSLPITVDLPTFGFYSSTEPSQETYLPELRITDANEPAIFYFVAIDGATIESVMPIYGFEEIAQVEQISDTCWQIAVNGSIEDGRWYHVSFTGTEPWGDYIEYGEEAIVFHDVAPRLVLRQLWETEDGPIEHPDWEWGLYRTEWSSSIDYHAPVKLYFFDGENYIPVDFEDLRWDGCIHLYIGEGEDFIRVEPTGCGSGTIYYDWNGNTYAFSAQIVLPNFGFYTSPEASDESYLGRDIILSGDYAEIYFIAIDGATLTVVEPIYGFENFAVADQIRDNCWRITISGDVEYDRWCDIRYSGIAPWGEEFEQYYNFYLMQDPNMPHLAFRDIPMDENGNWYEDEEWDLNRSWYGPINCLPTVRIYFFDGENYVGVDPDALTCSGGITIERIEGTDYISLNTDAWGDHWINYEVDGVVYSLPITVGLPTYGFYTSPEPSEESFIPANFQMSGNSAEVYFIAINGATLYNVEPIYGFENFASAERIDDTCWKITIFGDVEYDRWYNVRYSGNEPWNSDNGDNGDFYDWEHSFFLVQDPNMPHLAFRDIPMDEEGNWYEDEEWWLNRSWYGPIGCHTSARIYFFDGENYNPVDPEALTCSEGIMIERIEGTDFIFFITNAWGDHWINYEVDGVVYSLPVTVGLPDFGFYSTMEPSEETYLTEMRVSDENNVFYFVAAHGATLTNITLHENFEAFADIEHISDTCWQITITGEFESGCGYGLLFDGVEPWGGIAENWEQYITLVNEGEEDTALLEQAEAAGLLQYLTVTDLSAELTRLDAVKLLAALLDLTPTEGATLDFADCADLTQEEKDLIAALVETGIINGTGPDTFDPYAKLTHAALATMIYRALGEPETENSVNAPTSVWYLKAVLALQDLGIITQEDAISTAMDIVTVVGALEWTVKAKAVMDELADAELLAQAEAAGLLQYLTVTDLNAELTRLDAVKLLAALLDLTPTEGATLDFADCADLTQEEKDLIAALVETGIINGTGPDTFDPYAKLTHEALATMIYRALGEPETENSVNAPTSVWYLKAVLALQDLGIIRESVSGTTTVRTALTWLVRTKAVLDEGSGGEEPTIIFGDVNGDGLVNGTDTNLIFRYVSGNVSFTDTQLKAADVNGDSQVNGTDTNLVFRFVSGALDSLG